MLEPGVVVGHYLVKRKLAQGGMAEIYLASAVRPGGFEKEVALKVIRSYLAIDPTFVRMFVTEAQLASRLNHANIVHIFDFGQHDETYYLAMEYVHGASLWKLQQRCVDEKIPFPPVLAAEIGAQVARGLAYAHDVTDAGVKLGIVHRDVSPPNVLLSFDGSVKLTDFGIAKARTTQTMPGVLRGKFAYMSPEQALGEPVDARTDVFALGVVLWELLCGAQLFVGDSDLSVLRKVERCIVASPAEVNPLVPRELSDAVMVALARAREDRFATAHDFERALASAVHQHAQGVDDSSVAAFMRRVLPEEEERTQVSPRPVGPTLGAPTAGDEDDAELFRAVTQATGRRADRATPSRVAEPRVARADTPPLEPPVVAPRALRPRHFLLFAGLAVVGAIISVAALVWHQETPRRPSVAAAPSAGVAVPEQASPAAQSPEPPMPEAPRPSSPPAPQVGPVTTPVASGASKQPRPARAKPPARKPAVDLFQEPQ